MWLGRHADPSQRDEQWRHLGMSRPFVSYYWGHPLPPRRLTPNPMTLRRQLLLRIRRTIHHKFAMPPSILGKTYSRFKVAL